MCNTFINAVGFTAATLTTFSFVPQFLKLIKTKKTEGLSLMMMMQIAIGLLLWIVYGLLRRDVVLISANTVGFLIVAATIVVFLRLKGKNNAN